MALSPMVLFISAVVNSSGMETAAAFAAWCGGLCVVARTEIPRSLAALTSLSFFILVLSRPISPFNAAVIGAVLATLAGWGRSRELIRNRSVRPIWVWALVATMVTVVMYAVFGLPTLTGVPEKPPLSIVGSVWLTLRLAGGQLRQTIGDFGWGHIPAPLWVIVAWSSAVLGLLAYGLASSQRCRRALLLLALAILAMPLIFESPQINSVGPYWFGSLLAALGGRAPVGGHVYRASSAWAGSPGGKSRLAATDRIDRHGGHFSSWSRLVRYSPRFMGWEGFRIIIDGFRFHWTPPGSGTLAIGLSSAAKFSFSVF